MKPYNIRNRRLIYYVLCALLALPSGCDTRRDLFDDGGVWVRIEVDWTQSGIDPEGMSIYLFSQDTGERTALLLTNETCDSVKLHAGRYSLFMFNETERSHDYISFRGTDHYHTAEAYVNPFELPAGSRYANAVAQLSASAHTVVAASEILAAAHIDGFEVDYEMIRNQARPLFRLAPKRLSTIVDVIIHLQRMSSLHTGGQQVGTINNMAEGVFLATDAPNAVPATYWFALSPTVFDPVTNSGTLRAAFATFGTLNTEAAGNFLSLYFLLRNGTEYPIEREVTGMLHSGETTPGSRLTVEIGLGLTDDDPPIELPEIPGGDGMFDVDVGDWDDNTNIDILF